jgi:hypothetical protein
MKAKFLSAFLILTLISCLASPILASKSRQVGTWSNLSGYLNTEVAVKVKNEKTVFGVLRAVETDSLKIQIVGKNSSGESVYQRGEIEKVWQATLKGGRSVGKGALIGAGIGAAAGAVAGAAAKESDPLNYAGVLLFGLAGGALGGIIGVKERNKKRKLIYSV